MTDTESAAPAQASLSDLRMPELQALAGRLGITGVSKMRKPQLVEAIRERRRAASQRPRPDAAPDTPSNAQPSASPGNGDDAAGAERERRQDGRDQPARREEQRGDQQSSGDQARGGDEPRGRQRGSQQRGDGNESRGQQRRGQDGSRQQRGDADAGGEPGQKRRGQDASRRRDTADKPDQGGDPSDQKMSSLDEIIHFPEPGERREEPSRGNRRGNRQNAPEQQPRDDDDGDGDGDDERSGRRRRGRDRYRDRKRRQTTRETTNEDEVEILEDDILIPVAGILDVLDNYAFVRTSGYLPGANDVYVSLGQVKKAGLRRGDAVTGAVRQPREGESQRQKFNALVRLDSVNGAPVEDASARPEFDELTPVHPDERLRLETDARSVTGRVLDLVAPIGKGQRALVVAEPKAGSTALLQQIATAVTTNHPEVHLMVVLVDERPEEVTDWQRAVAGEVIASTFDRPATDHTTVAELAIERAKRLVELGQDVVILLDSLTGLARAYNLAAPPSGRVLAGGVDAAALYPPKRFFGAARNTENGGSLTIVATELVETGSATDEVIAAELIGTASSEVRLRRALADKRVFPPVDATASGTSHTELMLGEDELAALRKLRRSIADLEPQAALEALLGKVQQSASNTELLLTVGRSSGRA